MTSTIKKTVKNTDKQINIKLSGELGITGSEELKTILKEYQDNKQPIKITIDNPKTVDLSTIQLFYGFKNYRDEKNNVVKFETKIQPNQLALLNLANVNIFENQ